MAASVLGAKQVDVLVARAQRRQLGLCEECGGVFEAATCAERNCPLRPGEGRGALGGGGVQVQQAQAQQGKSGGGEEGGRRGGGEG